MYVRVQATDPDAVHRQAEQLFASVTRLTRKGIRADETAFVTPVLKERDIREKLSRLEENGTKVLNTIRVSDF